MDHTNVGVIILTWNDWEDTLACLERVHAQSGFPRRIVVCDNGSGNRTADRLLEGWRELAIRTGRPEPVEVFGDDNAFAPLTLLRREENEGAAGGMNAALRLLLYDSECQAFWLLHNDTLPEPYALAALLHHAGDRDDSRPGDAEPRAGEHAAEKTPPEGGFLAGRPIGMVGSTLLFHDRDLLECAAGGRWSRWTGTATPLDEGVERYALTDRKDIAARLDYVTGASCLVLRSLVENIGLYDERFFLFYEDVEYGLRARRAGFSLNWAPGALVRHKAPNTSVLTPVLAVTEEPDLPPSADYLYVRNRFFLLRRERPWALPFAMIALPLPLSRRMFRGQKDRLRLVVRAAMDGARSRMGRCLPSENVD